MELDEVKKNWVGFEFDTTEFEVSEQQILDWALACGELEPRYTDPSDPDFQAPPTFAAKFVSRRVLPKEFPRFSQRGFDAGKCVSAKGAIRPGDKLIGSSKIHDIYEKTGRSGSMIFIVHRMEFKNQQGEVVSVVDWRMVQQPKSEEKKS